MRILARHAAALAALAAAQLPGTAQAADPRMALNPDGSITVPSFVLPGSTYRSAEALAEQRANLRPREPGAPYDRQGPRLAATERRYPVKVSETVLGGVEVLVFEPRTGVAKKNARRVLINLHGGGFVGGWPVNARLESIPIASVGGIKVVAVNYRKAPKHRFPAASEDIASVYRALLKDYSPSQIGIYGCSAGGDLTSQAVAWIDHAKLPRPGAIAILSGSTVKIGGDTFWMSAMLGGVLPSPPAGTDIDVFIERISGGYVPRAENNNPLVWPSLSSDLLARFPPTLLINGSRSIDTSSMIQTHLDLTKAGVKTEMYLWDGLDHCFTYNSDLPESWEAYG